MTKTKTLLRLLVLSLNLLSFTAFAAAEEKVDPATNPTYKTFDGESKKISDYTTKGKWLVVMIWANDCPDCNAEAKNYDDLFKRRGKKDIEILGLSVDGMENKEAAKSFIKRHNLSFPNLIGEFSAVAAMFEIISGNYMHGTPGVLIYNTNGEAIVAQVARVPPAVLEKFVENETNAARE